MDMKTTDLAFIDVHHHMVPEPYMKTLSAKGVNLSGGVPFPKWCPESALELMSRKGIDGTMLSLSSPGVYFNEPECAVRLAREMNEAAGEIAYNYPKNFGFFAHLPMPLPDPSVEEAIYALETLSADGIILLASSGDKYLGDPQFEDLLAELNKRSAVVFIHPNVHSSSANLGLTIPPFVVEFMFDTTRAVVNLLWTGAFDRYPDIQWIVAHGGATVPYLAWRLSLMSQIPGFKKRLPKGVLYHLKNLYYDTALCPSEYSFSALLSLVDPSRILFGSDFPFATDQLVDEEIQSLQRLPKILNSTCDFNMKVLKNICLTNATALFPRFDL